MVIPAAGVPQLYDLSSDIGEEVDLAAERAEVLHQMLAAHDGWQAEMMPPPEP